MQNKESLYPQDWFRKAKIDLRSAETLLSAGILDTAASHIQQSIEKYLKGFLLSEGWKLRRIHELDELLNEAVLFAPALEKFRHLCITATEYYLEDRYPFLIASELSKNEIAEALKKAKDLVRIVRIFYKKMVKKNKKKI